MKKVFTLFLLAFIAFPSFSQTKQQADSLHQLGRSLLEQGKYKEGREYTRQAMEMRKTLNGELNADYITSLNNYALSYTFGEDVDLDKALKLQKQVMKLCAQLRPPHPDCALYALNMGRIYYFKEDLTNAAKYWEQSLKATEKHGEMYEQLLEWLGMIYEEQSDRSNLERIYALMEEHNQHELSLPCEEVKCMLERGDYYAATGDNASAKEWYLKAIDIAKEEEKAQVFETYGKFLGMNMKDFASGAIYMLQAAKTKKEQSGENEEYYKTLNTAGIYSFLGAQYQQAIDCYLPVIAFYQQFDSATAKSNVAQCQKNLGNAYMGIKEYSKAKECFKKAIDYYEKHDQANEEYPRLIAKLASAEKFNKEYDDAIEHYQQALTIFEERNMVEDYSSTANSLNLCYAYAGRDEEVDTKDDALKAQQKTKLDAIIKEEKESLQLTRDYLGELVYAQSLSTIAGCYALEEDYANAIDYYIQYMSAVRDAIRTEFQMQSEEERMITWNHESGTMQELKELLLTLPVGYEALMDDMAALVYDAALLSKGILLNSSIEFEKLIATKGNTKLQNIYHQTKANTTEIDYLRSHAVTDDDLDKILRLTEENKQLQLQLYRGCSELADFTDYIGYDWKDVQRTLTPTDVAIEFVAINISPLDQENYMAALVLTSEMASPMAVPICDLTEVKAMGSFEQLYDLDIDLVWGMVSSYLEGKRRVFFSADGGFNHIGIEYLLYNGKPLSEQFEVYRLSSTKELCLKHQAIKIDKIALFGDINYNAEAVTTEKTEQDLLAMRGGESEFSALSSTRKEVDTIEAIMQAQNKKVIKLTKREASQTAFMKLSGTKVNLIHIATHGKYSETKGSTDSESMDNSFLAFAGANLQKGIVTASDIGKMDLRQCDLAVLSACETGLGKLGDDGVFGLQRGFKNAGVHSLLMSIKNVYDTSTANLMICFYQNLANGLSKREALVKAQKEVRTNGFPEAKYWATFILLDALD